MAITKEINVNCKYCGSLLSNGEENAMLEYFAEFGNDGEIMCDACAEGTGDESEPDEPKPSEITHE
jgi:Cys-tRNA synthase (O-phospho-L-seryl-tRNA:Cys-tRNA synthase)